MDARAADLGYLACLWCAPRALHIYCAVGRVPDWLSTAGVDLAAYRPLWLVLVGLRRMPLLLIGGAVFSYVGIDAHVLNLLMPAV